LCFSALVAKEIKGVLINGYYEPLTQLEKNLLSNGIEAGRPDSVDGGL